MGAAQQGGEWGVVYIWEWVQMHLVHKEVILLSLMELREGNQDDSSNECIETQRQPTAAWRRGGAGAAVQGTPCAPPAPPPPRPAARPRPLPDGPPLHADEHQLESKGREPHPSHTVPSPAPMSRPVGGEGGGGGWMSCWQSLCHMSKLQSCMLHRTGLGAKTLPDTC